MTGWFEITGFAREYKMFFFYPVDPVNHVYWTQKKNASRRAAEITERKINLMGFAQEPKTDTVSIARRLISLSEN